MGAQGQPEGAIVGENDTAQKVYESLQRGEMPAFATKPNGVPPVGGNNVPFAGETIPAPPEGSGVLKGLAGLRQEVVGLRKDIRELLEVLKTL